MGKKKSKNISPEVNNGTDSCKPLEKGYVILPETLPISKRIEAIEALEDLSTLPWIVRRSFPHIYLTGPMICFGGAGAESLTKEEAIEVLEYLLIQLKGTINV